MNKKQWVQHISGQGEKWLVVYGGDPIDWMVLCKATDGERNRALPKSEYRLCEPPEVWRDVSEGVTEKDTQNVCWWYWEHEKEDVLAVHISKGYRLRKVQALIDGKSGEVVKQWAFIVEQKEPA